jgi:hypothetical protein
MDYCSFSDQMLVRHEVAISTVILEFQEITLRSAVSGVPGEILIFVTVNESQFLTMVCTRLIDAFARQRERYP